MAVPYLPIKFSGITVTATIYVHLCICAMCILYGEQLMQVMYLHSNPVITNPVKVNSSLLRILRPEKVTFHYEPRL